mgnify:CR=1 FL=1
MGNLLSYSGLATKLRAMQSRLLTDTQYRELAEQKSVPQAVAWLKQRPAYEHTWASLSESELHRGRIEQLLINSVHEDFAKVYRFANVNQRKFLDLYFGRYEVRLMKECLNKIFDHRDVDLDLSLFKPFFDRHSRLDISRLTAASSIQEFVENLKGTPYYIPLRSLSGIEEPTLFDYEMTLDLYYFSVIWKTKDKIFKKKDLEEITRAYGSKFDLLNLQWIYRSKKYYSMATADIYALLIPVNYKISQKETAALVEAENMSLFESLLAQTYYGRRFERLGPETLEEMYSWIMKHILLGETRKDPYSAACIYCYFYHKEHEIDRLTTVLECIRYGISPDDTMNYILKY